MQFDGADGAGKDATRVVGRRYRDAIARAYADLCQRSCITVYWSSVGQVETALVEAEQKGVALMSGFSQTSRGGQAGSRKQEMMPLSIMMPRYSRLGHQTAHNRTHIISHFFSGKRALL